MIITNSSHAHGFGPSAVKSLRTAICRLSGPRESWNVLRVFARESWIARIALSITVAAVVLAALRIPGIFESLGGWPALRNVSGWVGPAAVAGAMGAAAASAAAAGAGGPGQGLPESGAGPGPPRPDDPKHPLQGPPDPNGRYTRGPDPPYRDGDHRDPQIEASEEWKWLTPEGLEWQAEAFHKQAEYFRQHPQLQNPPKRPPGL